MLINYNGGTHKNKEIKTYIKETNNYLLYSVPYKYKTNAIESFFSQFRHYFAIENTALIYNELNIFVNKTLKKIPKTSYKKFMKYAYRTKENKKI